MTAAPGPRRSALYMPAANARALEKARMLAADVIIFDLEDAVAPEAKALARQQAVAALASGAYGRRELVLRINGLDTAWGADDLAAAAAAPPDAILLPKPRAAADIGSVSAAMDQIGLPARTRLWAMLETPLAILNAGEIAATGRAPAARLAVLVMGLNDLAKETSAQIGPDRRAALYWLSASVTAARAYGLDILDGACNDFRDAAQLDRECRQGRALGFDGKTLIHPDQIDLANAVFAPPAAEVAWARRIIAAFAEPAAQGRGVINVDGRMVELLHVAMARRTVAVADAIAG